MAENNLISVEFTTEELKEIDDAIVKIQSVLQKKVLNLTPQERQQFGQIAEQNKLFVNKVKQLMEQYPEYVPTFLDKAEFDKDYEARGVIESRLLKLTRITEQLSDTKIALDNDNYFNAITFYRNIRFLSQENIPGINTLYNELKKFFKGGRKKTSTTTNTTTNTTEDKSSNTPTGSVE